MENETSPEPKARSPTASAVVDDRVFYYKIFIVNPISSPTKIPSFLPSEESGIESKIIVRPMIESEI